MSEYEDLLYHERRARQAQTLGDTLRVQQPEEVVEKCSDCCCCFSLVERIDRDGVQSVSQQCADNPELVLTNLTIRHPECPRVGKRTVWPEVDV